MATSLPVGMGVGMPMAPMALMAPMAPMAPMASLPPFAPPVSGLMMAAPTVGEGLAEGGDTYRAYDGCTRGVCSDVPLPPPQSLQQSATMNRLSMDFISV